MWQCSPLKKAKFEYSEAVTLHYENSSFADNHHRDHSYAKRKVAKRTTSLIDLNDDCFFAIFEHISVQDLCSIAQTSVRLNAVGCHYFDRKYKICDFNEFEVKTAAAARKFLIIFGALIKELNIDCSLFPENIMDAVIQHCATLESLTIRAYEVPDDRDHIAGVRKLFQNLKKLRMEYVSMEKSEDVVDTPHDEIFTPNGNLLNMFVNCKIKKLEVLECDDLDKVILESVFPQLESFTYYKANVTNNLAGFMLRHSNLKSVSLDSYDAADYDHHIPALKVLAANCKQLEKLEFGFGANSDIDQDEYEFFLDNLSKLLKITEIKVFWFTEYQAPALAAVLPNLKYSLEKLHLNQVDDGEGLIAAVAQLKKLRVLKLSADIGCMLDDINPLGELDSLNELSIEIAYERNLKFDLVKMVDRLVNLTKLKFKARDYKIGNGIYAQLVAKVNRRPFVTTLQIDCPRTEDFVDLHLETVKFIQFE